MVRAIDVHVHPGTREDLVETGGEYVQATREYFNLDLDPLTVEELAEKYRKLDIVGVLLAWDAETNTGRPPLKNDYVADIVDRYPDRFIGFASVDPWKGEKALREARRAIEERGLSGFKFHQGAQGFDPSDRRFYPLWETISSLGVPALFHMGHTGYAAGAPGGHGIKLKYIRPILIDDVAADFPNLTIIGAHPAWPWHAELLSVAVHKRNVYIELSGWSPKYIPGEIYSYVKRQLADRTLFGSDHPWLEPDRWLEDFEEVDLPDSVKRKVTRENAARLLDIPVD